MRSRHRVLPQAEAPLFKIEPVSRSLIDVVAAIEQDAAERRSAASGPKTPGHSGTEENGEDGRRGWMGPRVGLECWAPRKNRVGHDDREDPDDGSPRGRIGDIAVGAEAGRADACRFRLRPRFSRWSLAALAPPDKGLWLGGAPHRREKSHPTYRPRQRPPFRIGDHRRRQGGGVVIARCRRYHVV
jgi:hypothetical protein